MDQAERSKYYFLDRIKARFGGQSPYTFCSAVWFTAGDRANIEGNLPLNYKEGDCPLEQRLAVSSSCRNGNPTNISFL